jgi:hypothetical protein
VFDTRIIGVIGVEHGLTFPMGDGTDPAIHGKAFGVGVFFDILYYDVYSPRHI